MSVFLSLSVPAPLAKAFLLWNEFESLMPAASPRHWELDRNPLGGFLPSRWRGSPPPGGDGTVTLTCLGDGTTQVSVEFRDNNAPEIEQVSTDLHRFLALVKNRQAEQPQAV